MVPGIAQERLALRPTEDSAATFKPQKNLWRVSVGALALANVLDVHSSWGKRELNPNLANGTGTFGREGALLKAGIEGGAFLLEYLMLRRRPSKEMWRGLALVNFGNASLTGVVAGRNYRIARP